MWAHLQDEPPTVTASRPDLPADIDAVIARALAKDPETRFETCSAMVAAARAALLPDAIVAPAAVTRAHGSPVIPTNPTRVNRANAAAPPLAAPPLAGAPGPAAAAPPLAAPTDERSGPPPAPPGARAPRRRSPARAVPGAGSGPRRRGCRGRRAHRQGRQRQAGPRRRQGRRQRPARADLQGALDLGRRCQRRPGSRADATDRPRQRRRADRRGAHRETGAGPPARRPAGRCDRRRLPRRRPRPAPHGRAGRRRASRDRVRGAHRSGCAGDRLHERRGVAVRGGRGDAAPALRHGPRRPSQPGLCRRTRTAAGRPES